MIFLPPPFMATVLTTISFVGSTTSTAATITGSASVVAGDLLILWDVAINSSGTPTSAIPTDFNTIVDFDGGGLTKAIASYKIADGSEASASLTGMDGTSSDRKILGVWRGDVDFTSVTVRSLNSQMTTGNPTGQSCTAASGTPPLLLIGAYYSSGAITTRSITPGAFTAEISNGTGFYLNYLIYDSAPASQTIDMADFGNNALTSFYLTFNGA